MTETTKPTGLALLRAPFPEHQISKLPKPTKAQTDAVKADFKKGIRCKLCEQWHHPDVVHLDYVGHAALTYRLLDVDPHWYWEPYVAPGLPNPGNGMWIKLHVCGQSQIGYGHADGKSGGDAIKEVIGDALRNAAMRFGAALDLWHKGELHVSDDASPDVPAVISDVQWAIIADLISQTNTDAGAFCKHYSIDAVKNLPADKFDAARKQLNGKLAKIAKELAEAQTDNSIQY